MLKRRQSRTYGLVAKLLGQLAISGIELVQLDGPATAAVITQLNGADAALAELGLASLGLEAGGSGGVFHDSDTDTGFSRDGQDLAVGVAPLASAKDPL